MKQFKALLVKEWHTHRRLVMVPIWVNLAVIFVILMGLVVNFVKTGSLVIVQGYDIEALAVNQYADTILWYITYIMAMVFGYIALFVNLGLADNLLNEDFKKKCEILHLSQPISIQKIMGAKLLFLIAVPMGIALALSVINGLVVSVYMNYLAGSNVLIGLIGIIQGFLTIFLPYVFSISLAWLASSIFKNRGLLYFFLGFLGLDLSTRLMNFLYGWKLPSIWDYVSKLALVPIRIGRQNLGPSGEMASGLIDIVWQSLPSADNLQRVLLAVFFVTASYFFYKRREIS